MAKLCLRSQRRTSWKTVWSLVFLALFTLPAFSQSKVDTIFDKGAYKSYFNYQLQEPLYVSYVLYHGGGNCSRTKFRFKNDTGIPMADDEYTKSGYDRGHLANAEDFAYDCPKDELTFRYYNCLPQTPNMNRGVWKSWETKIREESQTDSLLIVTGGIWEDGKHVNGMAIPNACWKVVYSLKTKKVLHVIVFTNLVTNSTSTEITLAALETRLKYKVPLVY